VENTSRTDIVVDCCNIEAANSGATKTKIMYDVFILSVMLAAKTNIGQHCLKNCLMKMRRKELNYNKKVRIFDPRELTMN
jgi:predicted transcriptional regulator